jgi:hypothetical protein
MYHFFSQEAHDPPNDNQSSPSQPGCVSPENAVPLVYKDGMFSIFLF